MDLQELHERSGVSKRKLRYCLDHKLVPGLNIEIASDETGRPRKFHESVGFGLVCAARLQELGLPHDTIRHFIGALAQMEGPETRRKKRAMLEILDNPFPAIGYLGDGVNVMLSIDGYRHWESGWFARGNPAKLSQDYEPIVTVALDLGQIRAQVFGES